jgi:NAD(P)-dependent dehydrogenase (short-subunit alcohol dehydrogenase family)
VWTEDDIADLTGRTALVTGANSGIGLQTARLLRAHGADVVLACRDPQRAAAATAALEAGGPGGAVRTLALDLASLASVRTAAARLDGPLDLLVCNAGVMLAPEGRTEDGFELHMGTNHLGHFALTGLLLDRLLAAPGSRVVVVGSLGARLARLDVDRLDRDRGRSGFLAYARSKEATLLFAQALHRRLTAAGTGTVAVAAHPGGARTGIVRHSERLRRRAQRPETGWRRALFAEPDVAALSVLRAATDPAVTGGEFFGPDGPLGLTGAPAETRPSRSVLDPRRQDALWTASERLTGVTYRFPVPARPHAGAR